MEADELEELKFHWDKWKAEAKAFFGRAVLTAPILILSILFQWQAISVEIPGFKLLSHRPLFYWFIYVMSFLLFLFLVFKFVDMLRHRVPEAMESKIHNNLIPNPLPWRAREIDLRTIGRYLWFVFVLYAGVLALSLVATFFHLMMMEWH
jgi:hypothetical protein